jgi:antitoxin (DNA-binding transcriptional repressor) of toxin-antitoxin stability system
MMSTPESSSMPYSLEQNEGFMTVVTTSEAQSMLAQLIASVAQGEEVLITDDGLPVAQLVKPNMPTATTSSPATHANGSEADVDEDGVRPWRGVFAIESPGAPYPCGKLHLSKEPWRPTQEPVDILWDRVNHSND